MISLVPMTEIQLALRASLAAGLPLAIAQFLDLQFPIYASSVWYRLLETGLASVSWTVSYVPVKLIAETVARTASRLLSHCETELQILQKILSLGAGTRRQIAKV